MQHLLDEDSTGADEDVLRMVLPPGGVQRYREWLEQYDELSSLGGTMLFDVMHHPGKGNAGGTYFQST